MKKKCDFRYLWIGHAAFIILFILSSLFYLERVIFVDASGFAFRLIYDHQLQFTVPRFASVIPQILPMIGVWLHLPLKAILFLFSISYVLLFYGVFLITAYALKQKRLALAVPFVLLLGSQFSFYWCVSETFQSNAYTVMLAAFLYYSTGMKNDFLNRTLKILIAVVIIFLIYFTHPVSVIPMIFVLLYFLIDQKLWKDPYVYILLAFLVTMALTVVFVISPNKYDNVRYNMFFDVFNNLGVLFRSETLRFVNLHILNVYLFSLLIFGITCFWYIYKKYFLKLILYTGSVVIFLLIVFLTFYMRDSDFVQEKNINPVNVILLVPFFHEVILEKLKFRIPVTIFLILFMLTSTLLIVLAYPFNNNRLKYISHVLELTRKYPQNKFLMDNGDLDKNAVLMTWAFGTETLLLSSLESPDSARTIYIPGTFETVFVDVRNPDIFISARWAPDLSIRKMDKNLFNLGNNCGYRRIYASDFLSSGITVYNEDFEERGSDTANLRQDSTGNKFFLQHEVYSPGYGEFLHKITKAGKIYIKASARIRSFQNISTEFFGLVIQKLNKGEGQECFYSCYPKACSFPNDQWTQIFVSGVVTNNDPDDIVKVFIWNPKKLSMMIDDITVEYYEDK